jgi:predicted RNA-binding Zn-ribbon protein involved in translation (DUF1610 family)
VDRREAKREADVSRMSDEPETLSCPACGESFAPAETALQECPHCGEQFFIEIESEESDEDREARDAIERRLVAEKERLDDRHIRVVQLEKRSLYRSRSWMLVLGCLLIGLAGQLVWRGVVQFEADATRAIAYFVIAVGLIAFSVRFFRRAKRYLDEARAITLPEPTTPPDFSTLSDGRQIVDHLRSMSDRDD